jgi:AcrR family transcriptional regulator
MPLPWSEPAGRLRVNENGRETQERLLDAAERLFAERGIDAVSSRNITDAAGVNAASIHYHFGTMRGLVVALVERLGQQLGEQRDRSLDALEASGDLTLESVVGALVRSTAELAADPHGRHHAGFIVAVTDRREYMGVVHEVFDPYTRRYLDVLARVTPHLDEQTRLLRYGLVRDVVNRVVGQPDGALQRWLGAPDVAADAGVDEAIVDEITHLSVAIFAADPRP